MKLPKSYVIKEICQIIECEFIGPENHIITGINEIHMVEEGDMVFVDHPKYYQKALESKATTIIIDKEVECPKGKALIISAKPFDTYNKLCKYFSPFKSQEELIGSDCKIDPSAIIFPNVFIGHRSIIGANVIIHAGVCIQSDVVIEENAVIGPNTVIGHDAFYYKKKEEGFDRMHSCGGVKIEKNVEIGASCTIDKGVSGLTIIGEGTKIDNHVHIGHDTQIGKKCLIAAQVGIAGCTIIEDEVTMWGQVGCASGVTIGKKATILAQSGISKSLEGNKTYFGSPAEDIKSKYREMGALRMLPEIIEKMKK